MSAVTRRVFLVGVTGLAGGVAIGVTRSTPAGRLSTPTDGLVVASTTATDGSDGPAPRGTLVVISLRGGMDGLSALVPLDDATYRDARPTIAVGAADALPIDGVFGLHPSLAPLLPHWDSGAMAVVPACGLPAAPRSHFAAQGLLDGGGIEGDGWLGRYGAGATGALEVLSAGTVPSGIVRGSAEAVAVANLANLTLGAAALDTLRRSTAISRLAAPGAADRSPTADLLTGATMRALATLDHRLAGQSAPVPDDWGGGPAAAGLWTVARLLGDGVALRAAAIDVGGWDHHTELGPGVDGAFGTNLGSLAKALAAFAASAAVAEQAEPVTVVVVSEFGRRVAENTSRGCDHGRGTVAMVLAAGRPTPAADASTTTTTATQDRATMPAGNLVGGRHGEWPGLSPDVLDNGDVPVANDVRSVLAEVVERRHGGPASTLFPDLDPALPALGLIS